MHRLDLDLRYAHHLLVERGEELVGHLLGCRIDHAATHLAELAADPARRLAMATAARALAMPDAADRVADAVLATIQKEAA